MPEGFTTPGGGTAGPVHNDPQRKPAPDAAGPRGYTWNRQSRSWQAKVKGEVLFKPAATTDLPGPGGLTSPIGAQGTRAGESQGDPDPGWFGEDAEPQAADGKKRLSLEDVPQAVRDDIAGFAGLVGAPVLAMLQQADPYCGTILAQSFEPIVDACLPLICRSEKIVRYFSGDQSDWLLWGKLAMALAPVAKAVIAHHVTRTVEVVRDPSTGQVNVVERRPGPVQGDHLTPPQHEPAYAA
jgi:hypothetical protein